MDFLSVLCEAFAAHFNVMKRQPTTMDILSGVKKETLHGYIDQFTKVEVVVGGSNEILKCWIYDKSLRPYYASREKLGNEEAHILKYFLSR